MRLRKYVVTDGFKPRAAMGELDHRQHSRSERLQRRRQGPRLPVRWH